MRRGRALLIPQLLLLAVCLRPFASPPPVEADVWFATVAGEGGCWLGPDILRTVGVDPQSETAPTLRLSWADREIPYLALRADEGWGVFFFAPDGSSRYTRQTAIRLQVGVAGRTMEQAAPPPASATLSNALALARWEEDQRYLPQADVDIPWFWEPLYAPGATTHAVTLSGALAGPITATLRLWSHTSSAAAPDHRLRLMWDGQVVGEWEWDGQGMQRLVASWEETQPGGEHTLTVETPALPGVDVAAVWLDGWEIVYRRQAAADGGLWQAEGTSVRVEGVEPGTRALDVSDPLAPLDLGRAPADGRLGTLPGHRYWVGRPEEARGPASLRPAESLDVEALAGVVYLVVSPPPFHDALRPLLEHRRSQGLETAVATPRAVYDAFGGGQPDPEAIRALAQRLPALRYLLIVGDGAAEPWGYDGATGALRVVAPLTRTAVLGETPADALLGTDRDGQPVAAVGRFPAASPAEAAAMVDKTLAWESRGGPGAALLLSDDEPEFTWAADEIAALLPSSLSVQRLAVSDDEASRAATLAAFEPGPLWLNYIGHGSLTILGDEGVLTLEDGGSWQEPALATAWTCLAAYFIHPSQDSMAEVWLRAERGGAAAFLGPVGETTTGEQTPYALAFYRALGEGGRLGDAWLAALRQYGMAADVARSYTLLGDPALRAGWQ